MTQKFRFIKEVSEPVNGYNGAEVSTGDIVELDGDCKRKARNNPDYEIYYPGESEVVDTGDGTFDAPADELTDDELEKATAP